VPTRKDRNILLVEDERIIAISEAQAIKRFGYEVIIANSGEQAIELAKRDREIELILMDIDLGDGIDGPETARRILATRNIPIVFLTSHMEEEYVNSIETITSYGYVIKNSNSFVLQSSIKMAFNLFEANESLRIERDALRESKEMAERYLNVAAAIIISIDPTGNLVLANESSCKILGYDRGELIGRNWFDTCLPDNTREQVREAFIRTVKGEIPIVQSDESPIVTKDGIERMVRWHHIMREDNNGMILGTIDYGEDITEYKRVQDALRESDARCHEIIERLTDYIYTVYYKKGAIVKIVHNSACISITGYSEEDFSADQFLWFEMIEPEDRDRVEKCTMRIPFEAVPDTMEYRIRRKDGMLRWIKNTPVSHYNSSGALVSRDSIVIDITERKTAEENVRKLLKEKGILLREVNHRIKNNMASLASILSLQAHAATETIVKEALLEAQGRVESMLALYDKIYRQEDYRFISTKEYFDELMSYIMAALCPGSGICIELRIDDMPLNAERLFPLGILANELITNAIKHAFPQNRAGTIRVGFFSNPGGACLFSVADNGIGLPESIDLGDSTGLGLMLINELTKQLNGSIEINRSAGTEFRVKFAIDLPQGT
jgi:PAS domain S-box-containing protein